MAGYDFNFIDRTLRDFFEFNKELFPNYGRVLKTCGSFEMELGEDAVLSGSFPDAFLFEMHAYEPSPEQFAYLVLKDRCQQEIFTRQFVSALPNYELVDCLTHIFTEDTREQRHELKIRREAITAALRRIDNSLDLILKSPTPPPPHLS